MVNALELRELYAKPSVWFYLSCASYELYVAMENNVWNSFDFRVIESYVAVADINEGHLASVIGSQILSADYR